MGYAFTGPSGTHAEQLRNALHDLRRHVQGGEPLADFYLDVPQLLETAVDYITADVERDAEIRAAPSAEARCPHGRIVSRRRGTSVMTLASYPVCECCGWLYVHADGSTTRCRLCQ